MSGWSGFTLIAIGARPAKGLGSENRSGVATMLLPWDHAAAARIHDVVGFGGSRCGGGARYQLHAS
eukprot:scaffold133699_cov19-Prasinocladus_malaysianus.AAC.1